MSVLPILVRNNLGLVRSGSVSVLAGKLRARMWSDQTFIALRRDLTRDFPCPRAPVKFSIRPLEERDLSVLFEWSPAPRDIDARAQRRTWLDAGLPGCHVAVTRDDVPCFMQWVIGPADQDRIISVFGKPWPGFGPDSVLLEGAYTPPRFRRLPLMPAAMARIAELGRAMGGRHAIVYTGDDNASMIKAAQWAGFEPCLALIARRRLFTRRFEIAPTPPAST